MSMKYPVERLKYNKIVGKTRVENVAQILSELGFAVVIKEPENHDVDVWVYKNEKLVLVIEVLNWRKKDYLDKYRRGSIVKNLCNPKYENMAKLLIYSFYGNIKNQMSYLMNGDIDFLELDFQTQPPDFFEFYGEELAIAHGMKSDGEETNRLLKEELLGYLKSKNLI